MTNCFLVCLSTSQGHGPWPVSSPRLPCVLYMERVDGWCGWRGVYAELQKGVTTQNWYVCLSKASRRLASLAQTAADPRGDSPASSCCWVPLKTPRPCLSDWPYGRQCHPGTPCCARHGMWEAWVGSMAVFPNSPYSSNLVSSISAVCPITTTCCNLQYNRKGLPLHVTHIQTHIHSIHTHQTQVYI